MRMVQMNNNAPVAGGLVELNTKIRDGVAGEGQGLWKENESRINEDVEDINKGKKLVSQLRGPIVSWERFLPLSSLKVLLVENDDSTRHVVSALLRNCGYEVTAVSNGLQAWKILQDLTNHIDLILTEVVMPCLSGIGLLGKIMNHKAFKNIPVIMMSSHDSMNIVLKCLSKGAADFLVKPIRKNKLKNLWQHVWRKCHSSSGSGSGSGIQDQKSTKSKSADSDNNNGSNKEDDFGSVGLNAQDRSDNGSGTQSSWTKKVVEVDSSQPISTSDQVMHSRSEVLGNSWFPVTTTRKCDELDNAVKVSDMECKVIYKTKEMPYLELSLKRPIDVGDTGTSACERNVLRSSDLSAFSRYNSGSITNQAPIRNVGSCSPLDNSSKAANTDPMKNFQSNSNNLPPDQQSNGSSNNNDMGSTTNNAFSKPVVLSDKPAPNSSFPSEAFQPVRNGYATALQPLAQGKADAAIDKKILAKARGTDQQVQVQHHHHHYHHYHHHVHKVPQNSDLVNNDDSCPCGSSNFSSAPHVEANGGNRSLNGSALESNHGSNGQNGNITALSIRGLNHESENGSEKGGAVGGIGFGGGNGGDQNRFAQREAALNKFRQKRKERCFEKKVRYQSRKKLAEQRPRIRGQFVRQICEDKNMHTNC